MPYGSNDSAVSSFNGSTISSEDSTYTASINDNNFVVNDGTNNRVVLTDSTTRMLDHNGEFVFLCNGSANYLYNSNGLMAIRADSTYTFLGYDGNTSIILNDEGAAVTGFIGGTPTTGYVGELIASSDSLTTMTDASTSYTADSLTLTAGVWMVSGNVFCDDSTAVGGWVKAMIRTSTTFSNNLTTQFDADANENDFSITPMTRYVTVTEDTTVYLMYSQEIARDATWYTRIEAVRVA